MGAPAPEKDSTMAAGAMFLVLQLCAAAPDFTVTNLVAVPPSPISLSPCSVPQPAGNVFYDHCEYLPAKCDPKKIKGTPGACDGCRGMDSPAVFEGLAVPSKFQLQRLRGVDCLRLWHRLLPL